MLDDHLHAWWWYTCIHMLTNDRSGVRRACALRKWRRVDQSRRQSGGMASVSRHWCWRGPTTSPFPPMHPTPWSYSEAELDTCPKSWQLSAICWAIDDNFGAPLMMCVSRCAETASIVVASFFLFFPFLPSFLSSIFRIFPIFFLLSFKSGFIF